MLVSGFSIARNVTKFNYPIIESIQSVLPICDEFIINVGDSEDNTLEVIQSIRDKKIRIIQNQWDLSLGKEVLSHQTNLALAECQGRWAFYLQSDEVIHEKDLEKIKNRLLKYSDHDDIDALRFRWFHFFGSYYRYRIDRGWYQKQDRIIKNNGQIESYGDAYAFRRKDKKPLRTKQTGCFVYHYGWVQPEDMMTHRRVNAEKIGFTSLQTNERTQDYSFGDLTRFPVYFGTHPLLMNEKVQMHGFSRDDWANIRRKYWWHPAKIMRVRYKTGTRVKQRLQ